MTFRRIKRYTNVRPTDAQIAWCQKLGVDVTGDMSKEDVSRLIDKAQAQLVKTLLQTAEIRQGSIIEYCYPSGDSSLWVVTHFFQAVTWVCSLGGTCRRRSLPTFGFDDDPVTLTVALNYRLIYSGPPEWSHAHSIVPRFASEMGAQRLRECTDALHQYIGTRLAAEHKMIHETFGEYWSTHEVARLKTLFEQEFPEA